MRICRFDEDRLGLLVNGLVHDITGLQTEIRAAAPFTMKGDPVVQALPEWRGRFLEHAGQVPGVPVGLLKLLAPVARPSKTMAAPTNYATHIAEMAPGRAASNSKHTADIGKQGTDIPAERALDYVAGYCLGLDMVIRGPEDRSFRKSCDGYAVLGPWTVTADEIPDPDNVDLLLKVNGEVRQQTNTSDLIYKVRRLIEFASSFYTLYPGDVFYSGTPPWRRPGEAGRYHHG